MEIIDTKQCEMCGKDLLITDFSLGGRNRRLRNCKICTELINKNRQTKYSEIIKECHVCRQNKKINNFMLFDNDGIYNICHDCYIKDIGSRNEALLKNIQRCVQCFKVKSLDNFHVVKTGSTMGRIYIKCNECEKRSRREYRQINKIKIKERVKFYNFINREERASIEREKRKSKPQQYILKNVRGKCKKHNIPFNLKLEDIIIPEKCPVLGLKLELGYKYALPNSPSVDRIIPELGYIKGNIKIISHKANVIKSFGTAEEHDKVASYIRENTLSDVDYQI